LYEGLFLLPQYEPRGPRARRRIANRIVSEYNFKDLLKNIFLSGPYQTKRVHVYTSIYISWWIWEILDKYPVLVRYYYGGGGVSQLTRETKIDYREYLYSGTM
jgi:hypothetical protein